MPANLQDLQTPVHPLVQRSGLGKNPFFPPAGGQELISDPPKNHPPGSCPNFPLRGWALVLGVWLLHGRRGDVFITPASLFPCLSVNRGRRGVAGRWSSPRRAASPQPPSLPQQAQAAAGARRHPRPNGSASSVGSRHRIRAAASHRTGVGASPLGGEGGAGAPPSQLWGSGAVGGDPSARKGGRRGWD